MRRGEVRVERRIIRPFFEEQERVGAIGLREAGVADTAGLGARRAVQSTCQVADRAPLLRQSGKSSAQDYPLHGMRIFAGTAGVVVRSLTSRSSWASIGGMGLRSMPLMYCMYDEL